MCRWGILLIIACLASQGSWAQQSACSLSVQVQLAESHNAQPLYPAVMYIDELQRDFATDEKGRVRIDSICKGEYTFHVHSMGYEHLSRKVFISGDTQFVLKAAHLENVLQQVFVTDERNPTLLQSKGKLTKAELAANSGKSLGDMLQNINGVTALTNGGNLSKPVIHGLHSNRIVLLNNGIRQEDQQWGNEHAPNIDPFLANSITVVKGAGSVRYGTDAIAGVVLVEPAPVRSLPGWGGELNLAAFSNNRMGVTSGVLEHAFKKNPSIGFRLQGTFKKGGNYHIPGYWVANTGVEENNYSATLAWKKVHHGIDLFYSRFNTDIGIYTGSHTGNEKDKLAAVNSATPLVPAGFTYDIQRPRQHVVHNLAKARAYLDSRAGMWNLVYAYQQNFRQEYDVLRKESNNAQLNLTLKTQTLDLNLEHKQLWKLKGQVGVDGIYQQNYFRPGDRLFIPNYRSAGWAVYIIERYKYGSSVWELGLRYDARNYEVFNPEGSNQSVVRYLFSYNNLSGTVAYHTRLRDNLELGITAANAWRAPQATELFSAGLHHGAARIELGNKSLSPERSYNLNLETKYHLSRFAAEVSLYSQFINNFIYLQPGADVLTIRGYFKSFAYTQADAWLNGADITARYQWNKQWSTQAKGSFLRARNNTAKDWLILMPADRISLNLRYDFSIGNRWKECYVSTDAQHVFRQTRIPANFNSIDYPRPPAAYWVLGADIGTRLTISKHPLYLSLNVMNILNQGYRDYLDVFRYFIDRPGRNIVLRVRMPFSF